MFDLRSFARFSNAQVFSMFFESIKHFIDAKTASKAVVVSGDSSEGTPNDRMLQVCAGAAGLCRGLRYLWQRARATLRQPLHPHLLNYARGLKS